MKIITSIAFTLLILQNINAQFQDKSLIHHEIESKSFGELREISVYLPKRYFTKSDESMMVIYVLDAQGPEYFNMLIANLDYLTSKYRIIPAIIVGIHSIDRYSEFTPSARKNNKNEWEANFKSKLSNLNDHFEKEVFPFIASNYRTEPFRVILGHSRGGSYVIHSLFDIQNNLFNGYLAISPALQFDNYQSIDLARERLSMKDIPINNFLYCSSGNLGENELFFNEHVNKLDSIIKSNHDPSLKYYRFHFPNKDHFTTLIPSINQGMVELKNEHMVSFENIFEYAKDTSISISKNINIFLEERKNNNTYIHEPPVSYHLKAAKELFELEDYKNAVDLYLWIDNKESINKWQDVLNIGICYSYLNKEGLANQYFEKSILLFNNMKKKYGSDFERRRNNLLNQIEEYKKE